MRHLMQTMLGTLLSLLVLAVGMSACRQSDDSSGDASARQDGAQKRAENARPAAYLGSLKRIVREKKLRVLMPLESRGFLPREGQPLSAERELAKRFAEDLGVALDLVHPPRYDQLIPWLQSGRGDVVIATLTATPARLAKAHFSDPLQFVREVLIAPVSAPVLHKSAELADKTVFVRRSSAFWGTLQKLKEQVPTLDVQAADESLDTETLIEQVGEGRVPYTVADSDLAEAVLAFRDDVRIEFSLTAPRPLGWAVSAQAPELLSKMNSFLARAALTGHQQKLALGDLDAIKKRGVLRVLTHNNAVNYWLYKGHEVGFAYDMVKAFAQKIGVRLEIVVPPKRTDLIPWLNQGRGDLIAAGLTVTAKRRSLIDFGPPVMSIQQVIIMPSGTALHSPKDLAGKKVYVRASSSYAMRLKTLSKRLAKPINVLAVDEDEEFEEIADKVAAGTYGLTVLDSNLADLAIAQRPQLVKGPAISDPQDLAWGLRKDSPRLLAGLQAFLSTGDYKPRGLMYNILARRYFGQQAQAKQSDSRPAKGGTISPYDALLRVAASTYQLDWRLLAAQMYQESRFDPNAKSWVGAQGLMQIMPATAKELGFDDVKKPEKGIAAGAKYMRQLVDRFDPTLDYKDRVRFALASYNAGPGHLDDARRLAAQLKWDPNRWFGNVEKAMLWLARPQYSRRARYGYVRGSEPVQYVSQIQSRFQAYSEVAN